MRLLLTFIPSRMKSGPDRAVVLMYKPFPLPPPVANPLGLRPRNLQYLMAFCCGGAQPSSCPIGERLVGCCSHCTTVLCLSMVLPVNPGVLTTTHKGVRLLDRKNPQQLDEETLAEVSWKENDKSQLGNSSKINVMIHLHLIDDIALVIGLYFHNSSCKIHKTFPWLLLSTEQLSAKLYFIGTEKGPGLFTCLVKLWTICLFLLLPGLQIDSKADHNPHANWYWWKYVFYAITLAIHGSK